MDPFTQEHRLLSITDFGLGTDTFVVTQLAGVEFVSRPFELEVELLCADLSVDPNAVVGQAAGIVLNLEHGRAFHGVVSRLQFGEMGPHNHRTYQVTLVPWLALLSNSCKCRIFQNQTTKDIVSQIFDEYGLGAYRYLAAPGAVREYCVQFNESDFTFVSRLLEEEGASYWFEHTPTAHTLVIADDNSQFKTVAETELEHSLGGMPNTQITAWQRNHEYRKGVWTLNDYDPAKPAQNLLASCKAPAGFAKNGAFEHYQYPGFYDVNSGRALTQMRLDAEQARRNLVVGASDCASFGAGGRFNLARHDTASEQGDYLLLSVRHFIKDSSFYTGQEGDTQYRNQFEALPAGIALRPQRLHPKPQVAGPQSALVVGPAGEEIYTDEQRRIKIQFHWDRDGQRNENSSCFVRVMQSWAGDQWGSAFIPRIGHEVIVSFLDGDLDRPLVTGSVYNGRNRPVFDTNAQSGVRSRSTKGGGAANFNEFRFDDKLGAEEVYLHAERDLNTVVENDQSLHVQRDRSKRVDRDERYVIGGDRTKEITGAQRETVGKSMELDVAADLTETVGGDHQETVTGGLTQKARTIVLDAADKITLKVGAASLTMSSNGNITLKGATIKVTASGNVILTGQKVLAN